MMKTWQVLTAASLLIAGLGSAQATDPLSSLRPGVLMDGYGLVLDAESYAQLELTAEQEVQFEALREKTKSTVTYARQQVQKVRSALDAELATDDPNFRAISELAKATREDVEIEIDALSDMRLDFYEQLSPEQQAIIHEELKQLLARVDKVRGIFLQLLEATNQI